MKTLTVTFHHTTNYGAVLQTYALHHTILSLGHDNVVLETISSHPKKKDIKQLPKTLYVNFLNFLRKKELESLKLSFINFHEKYIKLTRAYTSMEELKQNYPKVDCLITGSDQVWNLKTTPEFVNARLLNFGDNNSIKFSYAASIEATNYTPEQKELIKESLSSYKGISLREQSAKDYIESFTPFKCERVLDPVFLLDKQEWLKIAIPPRLKGPYILCYQVQSNKKMQEVADALKKKTGLPVVAIYNSAIRWFNADYSFHDVSIEEFIGFYHQAEYVVSASFHGVAMSLVFEKPVYALVKKARANRLKEIMSFFNLEKFIISQDDQLLLCDYQAEDLDNLRSIKRTGIAESINYLHKMLSL